MTESCRLITTEQYQEYLKLKEEHKPLSWSELKEEAKKRGGRLVVLDYKDYITGYAYNSHPISAIQFGNIYYVEDGDILLKVDEIKKLVKIKNVPFPDMCDQMLAIMKALQ